MVFATTLLSVPMSGMTGLQKKVTKRTRWPSSPNAWTEAHSSDVH